MKKHLIETIRGNFQGEILENERLSDHTSYRIGGPADLYAYPQNLEDLIRLVELCKREGVPRFIIGNGTNLLVSDEGFRGVVIDLSRAFTDISSSGMRVTVGAAVTLRALLAFCTERGLSGLESLTGIPGQVGGGIKLNAGAWGGEIGDQLVNVSLLDRFGTVESKLRQEIEMGYRKTNLSAEAIVLDATFELKEGNPKLMETTQKSLLKERKSKQPLSLPSAGSVFKRPENDYAGRLIQESGCMGMRIGDAMVSKKHANFIVNCGVASATDVIRLIDEVREKVFRRFGKELEPEIHFVGF